MFEAVRAAGKTAYCFIENEYKGEVVEFDLQGDAEKFMAELEALPQDHPHIRRIFDIDMQAERDAENFLFVMPGGVSAHIEAGVAYGMGKKCYAIGTIEKTETL
ncbi:hypothetical protein JNM87_02845 [Candidatus Saccharibacteria bacterium]|nr:hypothetical protein [Candidatus Saccharibacteria bacterium]